VTGRRRGLVGRGAGIWAIVGLLVLSAPFVAGGCRRNGLARAAAQEQDGRQGRLFRWGDQDRHDTSKTSSGDLYVGPRPGCDPRFTGLMPLADIVRHCPVRGRPIVFSGPTWCRYLFDGGSFLLMESPSFSYLRQSLVEGATIPTATGWGFVWTNGRGIASVVLREPDGSALVIQAPRQLCSRDVLTRLALDAAARMPARRGRPSRP